MFTGWVKNRIEERNEKVMIENNLNIQMDPKMARVFHASTKTSRNYHFLLIFLFIYLLTVNKGVSANMMKAGSKRRRTKAQIKEDKARIILEEAEKNRKLAELAELQARLQMLEEQAN